MNKVYAGARKLSNSFKWLRHENVIDFDLSQYCVSVARIYYYCSRQHSLSQSRMEIHLNRSLGLSSGSSLCSKAEVEFNTVKTFPTHIHVHLARFIEYIECSTVLLFIVLYIRFTYVCEKMLAHGKQIFIAIVLDMFDKICLLKWYSQLKPIH